MSLIPVFEIGVWNAWIFWALMFLSMIIPDLFMSKEAKLRKKRGSQWIPLKKKRDVILTQLTHVAIMPVSIVYSIFLPLKLGTAWFYAGLVILIAALVIGTMAIIEFSNTPIDQPITSGVYRISRHPLYLGGFLINLSIAIAGASWIILLCAILWIVFFHIATPSEESYLIDQYGDKYRDYLNRTPKWLGWQKSGKDLIE
jgi:protein-S-isoprenylcysteine O-methyltransferase Ste14